MFRVKNKESPEIMNRVFPIAKQNYNLRNTCNFVSRRINTVHYGTESLSHLGPNLWRILPHEYNKVKSLNEFKTKIKRWVPKNCPFRLCKKYIEHVGFI